MHSVSEALFKLPGMIVHTKCFHMPCMVKYGRLLRLDTHLKPRLRLLPIQPKLRMEVLKLRPSHLRPCFVDLEVCARSDRIYSKRQVPRHTSKALFLGI